MQYFGVPRCPYCKKRVNLIRTWSLKRQGEYQCPRCGGISNIFLSPLIYVFALLAVFAGGAIYFFHKFVLDDIDLGTCFQVLLPFVVFFLLSLFMVYLAKPVIKRVPREEQGKKGKARSTAPTGRTGQVYVDQGNYLPPKDYRTGPMPANQPSRAQAAPPAGRDLSPAAQRRQAGERVAAQQVRRPAAQQPQEQARVSAVRQEVRQPVRQRPAAPITPRREETYLARRQPHAGETQAPRPAHTQEPRQASHVVSSVEIPSVTEDFFKKYDDPAYVERRLKELEEKNKKP